MVCQRRAVGLTKVTFSSILKPTKPSSNRNLLKRIGRSKNIGHGDPAPGIFNKVAIFSTVLNQQNVNDIIKEGLAKALSVSPKERLITTTKYCYLISRGKCV